jgi:hypothetical protein
VTQSTIVAAVSTWTANPSGLSLTFSTLKRSTPHSAFASPATVAHHQGVSSPRSLRQSRRLWDRSLDPRGGPSATAAPRFNADSQNDRSPDRSHGRCLGPRSPRSRWPSQSGARRQLGQSSAAMSGPTLGDVADFSRSAGVLRFSRLREDNGTPANERTRAVRIMTTQDHR